MTRSTRIAAGFAGRLARISGTFAALVLASALAANQAAAAADAASSAPAAGPVDDTPTAVSWKLDVLRDGQPIDTFEATTMVGQTFSDTHHHPMQHRVGCKDNPAGGIDLARTVSVSPIAADPGGVTLAVDADETIEDDAAPTTPEGCKLPPQPRRVNASHPGLLVPIGQAADWTLIDKNPALVYRVHASVTSH
ncbi:hypothetical protein [Trinickia diaoshuihuensis]|uniref:hypothetical protein n=1 Tax=Trinickia diaoshuihuensis TaxID=2292265 RepID=UPI000E278BF6|nr:hypothetical protein [Trinickia diaoshuihuensis]